MKNISLLDRYLIIDLWVTSHSSEWVISENQDPSTGCQVQYPQIEAPKNHLPLFQMLVQGAYISTSNLDFYYVPSLWNGINYHKKWSFLKHVRIYAVIGNNSAFSPFQLINLFYLYFYMFLPFPTKFTTQMFSHCSSQWYQTLLSSGFQIQCRTLLCHCRSLKWLSLC